MLGGDVLAVKFCDEELGARFDRIVTSCVAEV